jgi:type 1 glutamine amidotransferase
LIPPPFSGASPAISEALCIVLVASKQDHGPGQHDYPRWQTNWLHETSGLKLERAWEWPSPQQFLKAKAIVFYFWNHNWSRERLGQLDEFLNRGGGVVLIHSAVISDNNAEDLAGRIGLSANPQRTGYRHMPFELRITDPRHWITRGLPETIDLLDEPYWPLLGNPEKVHVLAEARVDGQNRPLIWIREAGKGKLFASVPGHYSWTLEDPVFKTLLLRGIRWVCEPQGSLEGNTQN